MIDVTVLCRTTRAGIYSMLLLVADARIVVADQQTILSEGQEELLKASEALRPHPSLDTAPVDFSITGVHYRVPRNYIVTMDNWAGGAQNIVTLRVRLPDLKPVDTATIMSCVVLNPTERPFTCQPLSVRIEGHGMTTADQKFNNMKDLFRNHEPQKGPSGLERYDVGPDDARIEYYRLIDGMRISLYECLPVDEKRRGMCSVAGDRTVDGTELSFFFDRTLLEDISSIDDRLRALIQGFVTDRNK